MHLSMSSHTPPHLRIGGDLQNLKGHMHPGATYIFAKLLTECTQYLETMWEFGIYECTSPTLHYHFVSQHYSKLISPLPNQINACL